MKSLILSFCLLTVSVLAQQNEKTDLGRFVWVDTHVQTGNNFVLDAALNVEVLDGVLATVETQGIIDGVLFPYPDQLNSVNFMVGKLRKSGLNYISVSGGLGIGNYVHYTQNGYNDYLFFRTPKYQRNEQSLITLPLQIKAGIAAKVISLQIKAGANLNAELSTFHIGLGIGFGKLF